MVRNQLCVASVIVLMVLSFLIHTVPVTYAQSSNTSQLVTWSCTGSPCPWGNSLTGQALVWPTSMEPVTARLGYTISGGIYLPANMAAGMTITVTTGTATIYAGLPNATSHQALATLSAGQSFLLTGLAAGAIVSVQSENTFTYTFTVSTTAEPPEAEATATSTAIPTVVFHTADIISNTQWLADQTMQAGEPDEPMGMFLLGLGAIIIGGLGLMFVKVLASWHGDI